MASSFDVRYGMAVTTAVETCARHLASAGDTEGAAVLLGHLDLDAAPWSIGAALPCRAGRRRSPERSISTNSRRWEPRWTAVEPSSTRWSASTWGSDRPSFVRVTGRLANGQ